MYKYDYACLFEIKQRVPKCHGPRKNAIKFFVPRRHIGSGDTTCPKPKPLTSYLKYVVDHLVALFDGWQLPLDAARGVRRRRQHGRDYGNGHGDGRLPVAGRRWCALSHDRSGRRIGRRLVSLWSGVRPRTEYADTAARYGV